MENILGIINIVLVVIVIALVFTSRNKKEAKEEVNYNSIIDPILDTIKDFKHEQKLELVREFGVQKEHLATSMSDSDQKFIKNLAEFKESVSKEIFNQKEVLNKEFTEQRTHLNTSMSESDQRFMKSLNDFKDSINKQILDQMEAINRKVDLKLDEGFEKTNKTFTDVLQRLTIIDEAQKKMEGLSTNIISLQDILTDKKSRGTFGEIQLENILSSIFGENKTEIYEFQKQLSTGVKVDAILYAPDPLGSIGIDSKFPLENYRRMVDKNLSEFERAQAEKEFKSDVKKHITDISDKYIIPGETSHQAMMFLPAEAIFAEIHAYHEDLIAFSQKHSVWIVSPTTLMASLSTIQVVIKNMERDKYAQIIHEHLLELGNQFRLYKERWDKLGRNIETVSKSVRELNTTSDKISKRFNRLSKAEVVNYDTTPLLESSSEIVEDDDILE